MKVEKISSHRQGMRDELSRRKDFSYQGRRSNQKFIIYPSSLLSQGLIAAWWLGLQGTAVALATTPLTPSPSFLTAESSNSPPSSKCPADVETLTPLMLKDLPSYANRVLQRSRRSTRTSSSNSYVLVAGRPEFEPLTLGPGQYTPPASTTDLEPPKQVFFTTLERQYQKGKASYMQLYHWLFLTQTTDGWRVATMFSRIGSSSGRPPTPPLESSRGVVGQAVSNWLRDCRAGAIRNSPSPRRNPGAGNIEKK